MRNHRKCSDFYTVACYDCWECSKSIHFHEFSSRDAVLNLKRATESINSDKKCLVFDLFSWTIKLGSYTQGNCASRCLEPITHRRQESRTNKTDSFEENKMRVWILIFCFISSTHEEFESLPFTTVLSTVMNNDREMVTFNGKICSMRKEPLQIECFW